MKRFVAERVKLKPSDHNYGILMDPRTSVSEFLHGHKNLVDKMWQFFSKNIYDGDWAQEKVWINVYVTLFRRICLQFIQNADYKDRVAK
jgi:hypothetical protein